MKWIGALFLIFSAYALGRIIRMQKMREENILRICGRFLQELRDNIEFKTNPLREVVARCAVNDRYSVLDFLPEALRRIDGGANVTYALCAAYPLSECAQRLREEDSQLLVGLFEEMGAEVDQLVLQNIDYTACRLSESLKTVSERNRQQKGYYEALASLAGAAVAIVLL